MLYTCSPYSGDLIRLENGLLITLQFGTEGFARALEKELRMIVEDIHRNRSKLTYI